MEELPPEGSLGSKKVLLVVAGGIAAYKVAQVARDLTELGADVKVLMTHSAQRFVGRQTFASLTRNPVATDLWGASGEVPHVELARGADIVIIAPATAHVLAQMAAGLAGDLVTTTLLMARCPILAAPAMHTEMWEHPQTEENVRRLQTRGVRFLGPGRGSLSSGDEGPGRMVEPTEIVDEARRLLLSSQDLAGRHVLITAGGTQEPIDPVRYIGNHSSGRMGYVLADAALRRGAKVTLVTGPSELQPPSGLDLVRVRTAAEMRDAVVSRSASADVVVMAAAVADFTPRATAPAKIKKDAGPPDIDLVPTTDILAELGSSPGLRKDGGALVGFAAETESDPTRLGALAEAKRAAKGADMVIANEVGVPNSGFSVHTNRAVIAGPEGTEDLGLVTKEALATSLLDRVVVLLK